MKRMKAWKKIYITGKGRCNVTNACDIEELFQNGSQRQVFHSSFYTFTNTDIMDLIEKHGCPLKTERGNRVFPVSDKSSDVIHALTVALRELAWRWSFMKRWPMFWQRTDMSPVCA